MTLGENKDIALALMEEYAPEKAGHSDDADITLRINLIYSLAYQEISELKKILKTKVMKEITGETSEGYTKYSLPAMYQLKRVIALDENNCEVEADYKTIGKKDIYISNGSDAQYIIEYYAYPAVITNDTEDDFVLEVDQDAQFFLPYMVVKDILKADPSEDHTAFLQEYERKRQQFDSRREIPSMTAKEVGGVL
jgi:hypothetical protein